MLYDISGFAAHLVVQSIATEGVTYVFHIELSKRMNAI